jgi:hypothetical protein
MQGAGLLFDGLFDEYSLNARVKPSLLALLPVIISVIVVIPTLYQTMASLLSLLVACGLITLIAHLSRHRGRMVERSLLDKWGGFPSTIFLRYSDKTIDKHTKKRYLNFLELNVQDWVAPTEQDEINDQNSADDKLRSAAKWLIEQARDTKKYRLLFKENISYGFRRNCLGIKLIGIVLSLTSLCIIFRELCNSDFSFIQSSNIMCLFSGLFSLLMLVWWVFVVSDSWVRDAADSYALRLLAICDNKQSP